MDHRCGERHPARLTVLIRRRGWAGWVVAEIENLSVSGALVLLNDACLPCHALVRLEVRAPDGDSGRLLHCDAMVARVEGRRAGLAFDELAPAGLAPLFAGARHGAAARGAGPAPTRRVLGAHTGRHALP